MHSLVACSVGGVALVLTFIVTILDGLCFAVSNNSALESATVSLSTIACVALVGLLVLRQRHPQTKIWPWITWQSAVYGFLIGYLFLTAGVTAGTIAKSLLEVHPKPRFIARNIIWAFSVFIQAIFSGLLLVPEGNTRDDVESSPRWPHVRPHEMEVLPHRSRERTRQIPDSTPTLVETFRPPLTLNIKTSNDALAPWNPSNVPTRVSSRYSGRTLYQNESTRNSAVDLHTGAGSPTKPDGQDGCTLTDQDQQQATTITTSPTTPDDTQDSRRDSEAKLSMDSLLILPSPGLPSPIEYSPSTITDSSFTAETTFIPSKPKRQPPPPILNLPPNDEAQMNIHPLFRACSPSPPPTPLPGTMVKASPAAGTTISTQTLNRVRSTTSLRVKNNGRSRSPLFGQMDLAEEESSGEAESSSAAAAISRPMPGIIMAGSMGKV